MADAFDTVLYERRGPAALVTLNRPDAFNSFNKQLRADLLAALMKAAADEDVRVVVLNGAGRGFCAGADLKDVKEPVRVEDVLNAEYAASLSVIMSMDKPVIAAVHGAAAGIGMTYALAADLLVMGESAYLMAAFSNISLVPDGGLTWLLTRQLGYRTAYQLAIEAEKIDAQRCLEWGLANKLAPAGEETETALAWAEELSARAPLALGATKRAMRRAMTASYPDAAAFEAMLQNQNLKSADFKEGVAAFMEKRKPNFTGS